MTNETKSELNVFLEENASNYFIFFINRDLSTFAGIETDDLTVDLLIETDMEMFTLHDETEANIADERKKLEEGYEVFSLGDIKESDDREGLLELVKESL